MATEREKKESELNGNRFYTEGQRQTLKAIESQIERERRKVIFISMKRKYFLICLLETRN